MSTKQVNLVTNMPKPTMQTGQYNQDYLIYRAAARRLGHYSVEDDTTLGIMNPGKTVNGESRRDEDKAESDANEARKNGDYEYDGGKSRMDSSERLRKLKLKIFTQNYRPNKR